MTETGVAPGEVRAEVSGGVAWLTLSRPEKRNALTTAMWSAIPGVLEGFVARGDVTGVVVRGDGGTFGAGADLEDVLAATEGRRVAEDYCSRIVTALLAVATVPLPVLALVEGVAAGGGAELALACDTRIAEEGASFAFPFARLGVVPDRFTLARLAATVGPARARRVLFTGETVDAHGALSMGLVEEVTPPGGLPRAVAAWSEALQGGSRLARAAMKKALGGDEASRDVAFLAAPMVESMLGGEVRAAAERFLARRAR
jgi:enoyl-CoA hydratase/carnithine racemase